MNYELAKELKEAGWPQPEDALAKNSAGILFSGEESAYPPTLSELIEACGLDFDFLTHNRNGTWQASGGLVNDIISSNPEEAVAKLWLDLNKK